MSRYDASNGLYAAKSCLSRSLAENGNGLVRIGDRVRLRLR